MSKLERLRTAIEQASQQYHRLVLLVGTSGTGKTGLLRSVAEQDAAITLEPHSYALAAMLGEISADEDAAGRGMLTVIVVHRDGDMEPGPGFFELARELGRDTSDILRCWIEELKKVHKVWSGEYS